MKFNVPPLLEQIRENMLNAKTSPTIRHNYKQTMLSIKDYAEKSLVEYDKAELKKGR
jgi:hypothetical protein